MTNWDDEGGWDDNLDDFPTTLDELLKNSKQLTMSEPLTKYIIICNKCNKEILKGN